MRHALDDLAEAARRLGPRAVVIPKLVTAGKELGQLIDESMHHVKTVEGFGRRSLARAI
jgi:hypothetical protein